MSLARNQQPSFNFLTGADELAAAGNHTNAAQPPASRLPTAAMSTTSRRTSLAGLPRPSTISMKPTYENEAVRAQLNTLTYELASLRQSSAVEIETLNASLRDAERRAEAEYRRASEAERKLTDALKRLDDGLRESREERAGAENAMREAERKIRVLRDETVELREEVEDGKGLLAEGTRELDRLRSELEAKIDVAGRAKGEMTRERDVLADKLETVQSRLGETEKTMGELESEVIRLRAQSGDKDTLDIIKRELAGQVGHIRQLEKVNTDQLAELKKLRRERKAVEVAEEEKRTLETRLRLMEQIKSELAESQLQRSILEDEKRAWTSYLDAQHRKGGEEMEIQTPEQLARAYVKVRIERINLLEQIGKIQPAVMIKDQQIAALEQDVKRLKDAVNVVKHSTEGEVNGTDTKSKARLERQRNLAIKEVEYLRAQLRSLEDATTEFEPDKAADDSASHVAQLEALIDEYKSELQTLHQQFNSVESNASVSTTLKRPADDSEDSDSQLSALRRKLRTLQSEYSDAESKNVTLANDLAAITAQLNALRTDSRTRILELRSNPTATHQTIKASTLTTLQAENAALMTRLRGTGEPISTVPSASYAALEQRLVALNAELAQRDKKTLRLKQIWAAKAAEFTQAISSVLGWDVVFLPQGKLKLSSVYYSSKTKTTADQKNGRVDIAAGEDEEEGELEGEEENFILFDGEKGTMKISGGEKSRFARELRGMLEFWVDGRGEVPLFLAAASLEFWERNSVDDGGGGVV